MNLLGAKLYDPGVAVSKATSSLLAMTAIDTSNLRLSITVPAHGMVRFVLRGTVTGATTQPMVLLGAMNGATVLGRQAATWTPGTGSAATNQDPIQAEFTVTGLTPGAMNVDAAYAVQVVVASTNIKYGGPNDNSGNDAWGGFLFEAWDPQPQTVATQLSVSSTGAVVLTSAYDSAKTAASATVAAAIKAKTDSLAFTVAGKVDSNVTAVNSITVTGSGTLRDPWGP